MLFSEFTHYLDKLEQISSKNEMVKILSELILSLDEGEISRALYLSLGQLGPLYDSILFNMSDKLIIQAISEYSGVNEENISGKLSNIGDAGLVSAEYANSNGGSGMNILEVFDALKDIAMAHGEGSVKEKINKTASLMKPMSEAESKYVVRIILERLRMGIAEATIMDALSWAKTESKSDRKIIESAFNVYPDIGYIAETYMKEGVEGMTSVNISPGIPIRPAQSERLPTPEKIIDKLEQFAIEPKMDGFRAQIHVWGSGQDRTARIFSRNLNETTEMFPEIIEAIKLLPIESGIFDSEAIAYNPETGEFLP
ncbi:DNA ligase, partial [candidate division WWE3 bacterium]|nr:DNA ligase [candidate division WWE3 bacterium]